MLGHFRVEGVLPNFSSGNAGEPRRRLLNPYVKEGTMVGGEIGGSSFLGAASGLLDK